MVNRPSAAGIQMHGVRFVRRPLSVSLKRFHFLCQRQFLHFFFVMTFLHHIQVYNDLVRNTGVYKKAYTFELK